jgi:diguanylate cyclase (GGDEF)-like protein
MPVDDPSAEGSDKSPVDGDVSAIDDDQTLSDADQSSSDADQTGGDLDQTSSDEDEGSSQRDQASSDRDQRAADLDQAASDRLGGPHSNGETYARTRRTRAQTALARDAETHVRSETAAIREATAERRDKDAASRDAAAAARDQLAARLDVEIERLEATADQDSNGNIRGLELLLRASRGRKRAAASRERAAVQRAHAARDRELAGKDRADAADDRRAAAAELAAEGLDHLTGTLRRRVGLAAIQREIDRIHRSGESMVVGFVDVNGLKAVNDVHGHSAGDDLLAGVARCIAEALRRYDIIMRYGGDEFVCSLSGQDLEGARRRFEEISAQIAETQKGASIAVGFAEESPELSLDEIIVRADRDMIALRRGRSA